MTKVMSTLKTFTHTYNLELSDKGDVDVNDLHQWPTHTKDLEPNNECDINDLHRKKGGIKEVQSWMMKVMSMKGKLSYCWSARAPAPKPHVVAPLKSLGLGK
jgi:hypothetical protein